MSTNQTFPLKTMLCVSLLAGLVPCCFSCSETSSNFCDVFRSQTWYPTLKTSLSCLTRKSDSKEIWVINILLWREKTCTSPFVDLGNKIWLALFFGFFFFFSKYYWAAVQRAVQHEREHTCSRRVHPEVDTSTRRGGREPSRLLRRPVKHVSHLSNKFKAQTLKADDLMVLLMLMKFLCWFLRTDSRKYHSELRCVVVTVGDGQSSLDSSLSWFISFRSFDGV